MVKNYSKISFRKISILVRKLYELYLIFHFNEYSLKQYEKHTVEEQNNLNN